MTENKFKLKIMVFALLLSLVAQCAREPDHDDVPDKDNLSCRYNYENNKKIDGYVSLSLEKVGNLDIYEFEFIESNDWIKLQSIEINCNKEKEIKFTRKECEFIDLEKKELVFNALISKGRIKIINVGPNYLSIFITGSEFVCTPEARKN